MLTSPPATWSTKDVVSWAQEAKLAPESISALSQNQVDGPTLLTLTKAELQSELGIASLSGRRYLWDLLKSLRSEQDTSDFSVAIRLHEEEIQVLSSSQKATSTATVGGADSAGGAGGASLAGVIDELATEAQRRRQLVEDHMMAHRMQRAMTLGQQVYDDVEAAREEQLRLNQLLAQAEEDRRFAESLASGRERSAIDARRRRETQQPPRTTATPEPHREDQEEQKRFASLFGLSVQACATNKVDVAEAFRAGKVRPLAVARVVEDEEDRKMPAKTEPSHNLQKPGTLKAPPTIRAGEEDRKMPGMVEHSAIPRYNQDDKKRRALDSLPRMKQCSVCFEENKRGYGLACGHRQCISCTKKLFKTALGDASLLPLRCCEIPIDMNVARQLLSRDEASTILQRVAEIEAKNKMYCPSCSTFLNLDLVDTTFATDLLCDCGVALCIVCKTVAHPRISCDENNRTSQKLDEEFLQVSRDFGWKQCPKCSTMIELRSGCNHMTCLQCRHEFCYNCLQQWNARSAQCSSGRCELWDEARLVEAGEQRVRQEEAARGIALAAPVRQERLRVAMIGLRANEVCQHEWVRSAGYKGGCPNCSFTMYAYGMQCVSDCGSTVCYTCAHHRIPQRGWR